MSRYVKVWTDPDVSWTENRNGMVDINALEVVPEDHLPPDTVLFGWFNKRGNLLRGGTRITSRAMRQMCEEWLARNPADKPRKWAMYALTSREKAYELSEAPTLTEAQHKALRLLGYEIREAEEDEILCPQAKYVLVENDSGRQLEKLDAPDFYSALIAALSSMGYSIQTI
jgi:hypothetical protein